MAEQAPKKKEETAAEITKEPKAAGVMLPTMGFGRGSRNITGVLPLIWAAIRRAANYITWDNLTTSYARFKHYIESKRKEREDEKELKRLKDEKLKTMMAEGTPPDDEAKGVGSGKKRGPSSSKK